MEVERNRSAREAPDGFFIQDEELPRIGLDRMRADDEVYQHVPDNPAEWASYVMAEDGLPKPQTPVDMPFAPPLTVSNCICIVDLSKFVIRDERGDVMIEVPPEVVTRSPDGRYWALGSFVADQVVNLPSFVEQMMALLIVIARTSWRDGSVQVQPIRPQCKHFARQLTDLQDNDEHVFVVRICTARRDDGGEFLSIRDSQYFACDMRDPRDALTEERADLLDKNKMILGAERVAAGEAFDVDKHLDKMLDGQQGPGDGIFSKPGDTNTW